MVGILDNNSKNNKNENGAAFRGCAIFVLYERMIVMLHLTKISQRLVYELFSLKVHEYDFACDSIQLDSEEIPEFEGLPKHVLGHSLYVYENEKVVVSIQIVTDLDTSKMLSLKIQQYSEGSYYEKR